MEATIDRQRRDNVDAALLVDQVSLDEATTTGVVETNEYGKVVGMVEKPEAPSSRTVTTGVYVLPPAVFHALELVRPSENGEIELGDAVDLLVEAGYVVEAVSLEGWRVNVNTVEDITRAERLLDEY